MFTRHDYLDLGTFTMGLWTKKYAEILSIFDLPRLQEAMGAYVELESPGEDEDLIAASQDERNPDAAVMDAFQRLFTRIFITLYDRGVLAPFMVLEDIPDGAQRQLDAMVDEVESHPSAEDRSSTGSGGARGRRRKSGRRLRSRVSRVGFQRVQDEMVEPREESRALRSCNRIRPHISQGELK